MRTEKINGQKYDQTIVIEIIADNPAITFL